MAAITITASNVIAADPANVSKVIAGANITAGQPVYPSNSVYLLSNAANTNAGGGGACAGIALCGASIGQPLVYYRGGAINMGNTLTVGMVYCVGAVGGQVVPYADLATNNVVTVLGVANAANNLNLVINPSGAVKP